MGTPHVPSIKSPLSLQAIIVGNLIDIKFRKILPKRAVARLDQSSGIIQFLSEGFEQKNHMAGNQM